MADKLYTDDVRSRVPGLGKNLLINGDFGIWQRTASLNGNGFCADRWFIARNAGSPDTVVSTPYTTTPGYPFSGHDPVNYLLMTVTAAGGTNNNLLQAIEDVRTAVEQTVTMSIWVYSSVSFTLTGYMWQDFGPGGSSNVVPFSGGEAVLGTTWTRVTFTGTIPSVLGKTIVGSGFLGCAWEFPGNVTKTILFCNAQVEIGDTATDFEARTQERELALCQRYYEKSYRSDYYPGDATLYGHRSMAAPRILGNGYPMTSINFNTRKAFTPTIGLYSTDTGAVGKIHNDSLSLDKTAEVYRVGEQGGAIISGEAGFANDQDLLSWQWTAESEFI